MEVDKLMSGIAVVIDDELDGVSTAVPKDGEAPDLIVEIVERFQRIWKVPFYRANRMPSSDVWHSLLHSASFILLDWKLWPTGAPHLEQAGIETNIDFLEKAKEYFVPVFIFTNEDREDVESRLPPTVYRREHPQASFVFIRDKASILSGDSLNFQAIRDWISNNAAVYALKAWEQTFMDAKRELFSCMYDRSSDWPKVFWNAYKDDGVDPGPALTRLISDNATGRMRTDSLEESILSTTLTDIQEDELRAIVGETSFRRQEMLPTEEIRCGDVFKMSGGKYLLNVRPDCDCIPRDGTVEDVELYCVEGKRISKPKMRGLYSNGQFLEKIFESVAFAVDGGSSLLFDFRKFRVKRYGEIRENRLGRILYPYVTRVQQRFALFTQRQALPRVPQEALGQCGDSDG